MGILLPGRHQDAVLVRRRKDIGDYCWYAKNAPGNDPPVGSKKGNAWGLHEMHGYVWEWVQDGWHDDYKGAPADGSAWLEKDAKQFVIRGGGFNSAAERCRSAARRGATPISRATPSASAASARRPEGPP